MSVRDVNKDNNEIFSKNKTKGYDFLTSSSPWKVEDKISHNQRPICFLKEIFKRKIQSEKYIILPKAYNDSYIYDCKILNQWVNVILQ